MQGLQPLPENPLCHASTQHRRFVVGALSAVCHLVFQAGVMMLMVETSSRQLSL